MGTGKNMLQEFENELGNHIKVEVTSQEVGGVSGVLISMTGPASQTENFITRKEAEVLHQLLEDTLVD